MSDRLTTGQWMGTDAPLISADGRYAAYLQDDANLVLCYTTNGAADLSRPYWSAYANAVGNIVGSGGPGPYFASMQADGNFVLYAGTSPANQHNAYWATNTPRSPGQFHIVIQTDANFVLYADPATAIWASNTVSKQLPAGPFIAYAPTINAPRGRVTALDGLGLPPGGLSADLTMSRLPGGGGVVPVVRPIETFSWSGAATDPVRVEFSVSQQNAYQLSALAQSPMRTTRVTGFGFVLLEHDDAAGTWHEASLPLAQPLTGTVAHSGGSPELAVDMTPVPANGGAGPLLYKVSIVIVPTGNQPSAPAPGGLPTIT